MNITNVEKNERKKKKPKDYNRSDSQIREERLHKNQFLTWAKALLKDNCFKECRTQKLLCEAHFRSAGWAATWNLCL